MRKTNIAIIGGGLTGLVTAFRLAQEGHEVTIFEQDEDIGGLAGSFRIHGMELEKAYHHFFKTDKYVLNLIKELGLKDKLKWYPSSLVVYWQNQMHAFTSPLDLIRFKPLPLIDRIRTGLGSLYLQKKKSWEKYKGITAAEWLKKYNGEKAYKVIWEPLLQGKFHKYAEEISMAWFWARMYMRGNSRQGFGSKEMLGYLDGGVQTLINTLVKKLEKLDVEVLMGSRVERVEITKDKRIKIIPRTPFKKGDCMFFDKVVVTTPSNVFAEMIKNCDVEEGYLEKLKSINYIGAITMVFSSKQNLSNYYWHNINDPDIPFLVFVNHTRLVGRDNYEGKNVYYLGGYYPHDHEYFNFSKEELAKKWFDAFKKICPDFDENELLEKHIFKFKNAQHIVDTDYENKVPDYKTPIENIFLANFSQVYPEDRGINFAVREGEILSNLVMS